MIGLNYSSIDLFKNNDSYKLSSIVTEDNLLFSISNIKDNKILSIKEIIDLPKETFFDLELIKGIFESNNLLNPNIKEVSIGYLTSQFSLIPHSLSNLKDVSNVLSGTSIKQYFNDYTVIKSDIKSLEASNFFPFPKSLKEFLNNSFEKVNIHHANDVMISNFQQKTLAGGYVLANLNGYLLQTLVFRKGNLAQSNVYDIKTKEDILYHILAAINNNAIPINKATVYLTGRVTRNSAIFDLLYQHIKNLEFFNDIPRIGLSNVFLGKPKHLFYDIYSLSQCE